MGRTGLNRRGTDTTNPLEQLRNRLALSVLLNVIQAFSIGCLLVALAGKVWA